MSSRRIARHTGRIAMLALAGVALVTAQAVLGATQHAGSWMFFAYDNRALDSENGKHIDISGSTNQFYGDIKSNGDFDVGGSSNVFGQVSDQIDIRYYDQDGDPKLADNTYTNANLAQAAFSGWPGTLDPFTVPGGCDLSNTSTLNIKASDPDGLYCNGGDITVSEAETDGNFTFISKGQILI